jgi:hypothetical protein
VSVGTRGIDFTRSTLVTLALRDVGIAMPGRDPSVEMRQDAGQRLDALMEQLSASEPIWRSERQTFSTVEDTAAYTLPTTVWDIDWVATYQRAGETTRTPIYAISRRDFMLTGDRQSSSLPNSFMLERIIKDVGGQVATMTLYPPPDATGDTVEYVAYLKTGDDADWSGKWARALRYGLAIDLSAEAKVPPSRVAHFERQFETAKMELLANDNERAPVRFIPYGR